MYFGFGSKPEPRALWNDLAINDAGSVVTEGPSQDSMVVLLGMREASAASKLSHFLKYQSLDILLEQSSGEMSGRIDIIVLVS